MRPQHKTGRTICYSVLYYVQTSTTYLIKSGLWEKMHYKRRYPLKLFSDMFTRLSPSFNFSRFIFYCERWQILPTLDINLSYFISLPRNIKQNLKLFALGFSLFFFSWLVFVSLTFPLFIRYWILYLKLTKHNNSQLPPADYTTFLPQFLTLFLCKSLPPTPLTYNYSFSLV